MDNNQKNISNFIILSIADFISSFGALATSTAISLHVLKSSGNLFITSLFFFISLIPRVLATPFVAKIKINKSFKTIFAFGEFLCAILIALFLIKDSLITIFIVYGLFSVIFFVLECLRAEFLKHVSTDETIYSMQSITRIVNIMVTVITPFLSSLLLNYYGIEFIYASNVICYLIAGIVILFIKSKDKPSIGQNFGVNGVKNMFAKAPNVFTGSVAVSLVGGIGSLLTLSYIVDILKLGNVEYGTCMSLMALGGIIGSSIATIKVVQAKIKSYSKYGLIFMGLLFVLILFKPNYYALLAILTISGALSTIIMVYYSTQLYFLYSADDVRGAYAYFQSLCDLSTAVSKPLGGLMQKAFGTIYSMLVVGLMFIITSINDRVFKNKKEGTI